MPLDNRPAAQRGPNADWPKISFPTHRVKASIVVVAEFATPLEESSLRARINKALAELKAEGVTVETSYEQV